MTIEGSGSIPLTSGSGSGRPKNMWIRNTAVGDDKVCVVCLQYLLGITIFLIGRCDRPGHFARECPDNDVPSGTVCYRCDRWESN
jgi:hypothetical protein